MIDDTTIDEQVEILRRYIAGCIGRAKWWRDVGFIRPRWHERMEREVREARRLSQRVRRLLHQNSHSVAQDGEAVAA